MGPWAILLPAAGASSRMRGRDKLLEQVAGQSVLHVVAARACLASAHVAVTLRSNDAERRAALAGLNVRQIPVPDAAEGMAASLRAGAHWALQGPCRMLMIVLPDMPDITVIDLRSLMHAAARHPDQPMRAASQDMRPGHPVIFPRRLWPELAKIKGDTGAQSVLKAHPPHLFPLFGTRAVLDLDTPEDWAQWRAK